MSINFFFKETIQEAGKICVFFLRFKRTEMYSLIVLKPRTPKSKYQDVIRAEFPLMVTGKSTPLPLPVSGGHIVPWFVELFLSFRHRNGSSLTAISSFWLNLSNL